MRTFLKIVLGIVMVLAVVVAGAVAFAQFGSERKLSRTIAQHCIRIERYPLSLI